MLFAAGSSGETQVQGGGTSPTGPTETGPPRPAPSATAPTGASAEGGLTGAVRLDLSAEQNPTGAAMYSRDGVDGTMEAAGVHVEATGALQGVPIDLPHFFPEKVAIRSSPAPPSVEVAPRS